jgi:hypothetical protein
MKMYKSKYFKSKRLVVKDGSSGHKTAKFGSTENKSLLSGKSKENLLVKNKSKGSLLNQTITFDYVNTGLLSSPSKNSAT